MPLIISFDQQTYQSPLLLISRGGRKEISTFTRSWIVSIRFTKKTPLCNPHQGRLQLSDRERQGLRIQATQVQILQQPLQLVRPSNLSPHSNLNRFEVAKRSSNIFQARRRPDLFTLFALCALQIRCLPPYSQKAQGKRYTARLPSHKQNEAV